jgi:hypothetical protein
MKKKELHSLIFVWKEIEKEYTIIKKKNNIEPEMACTELAKTLMLQMRTQGKNTDWLKAEYSRLFSGLGPATTEIYKKIT